MKYWGKILIWTVYAAIFLTSCGRIPDGAGSNAGSGLSGLSGVSSGPDLSGSGDAAGSSGASSAPSGSQSVETSSAGSSTPESRPDQTNGSFLDAKSGMPDFSADEIKRQKEAGTRLVADIVTAAKDLSKKEFVIPAGNYGFGLSKMVNGVASAFVLRDIHRPDDNPFVIKAYDVTFWIELSGKPAPNCSRGVHLLNCDNIAIEGLTVDSYVSNTIEGKLTQIDVPGNRIEIKLSEGTITNENTILNFTGTEKRIIPVKADGSSIPSFYSINSQWGVAYLFIDTVTKSKDGYYWLHFKSPLLLNTVFSDAWISQYGKEGTLETGDGICLLYGTLIGVSLDNCKQITIKDLSCYIGKGGFWENGGYGNHRWINCRFTTRPGTNRILGGDGSMTQGLRHGSLFDNLYMGVTSDDAVNIHGFWSKPKSVGGNLVLFDFAPVGIQAGDPVEFYDAAGNLIETGEVLETPLASYNYNGFLSSPIRLKDPPSASVTSLLARWPNSECEGWKITNCYFDNIYQRILIQTGPGTFENNTVRNMGSNLALDTNTADYEGGFLRDIVVRNNVFINSGVHPGAFPIKVAFEQSWSGHVSATGITIKDNVIFRSGSSAVSLFNALNTRIEGNRFFDLYEATKSLLPAAWMPATAVSASGLIDGLVITGNDVYIRDSEMIGNGICNRDADLSSNKVTTGAASLIGRAWDYLKNKGEVGAADFLAGIGLQ